MLKQRVLTALLLIPLVIGLIFYTSDRVFQGVLGLVLLLGAWEWAGISGLRAPAARVVYSLLLGAVLVALAWVLAQNDYQVMPGYLLGVLTFWLLATLWILMFAGARGAISRWRRIRYLLSGLLVLSGPFLALAVLHARPGNGPWHVFFVLILIWVADSGAYFAGRAWGRRKLAPHVSPGKSWEGVVGGLVGVLLAGALGGYLFGLAPGALPLFIGISVATAAISVLGDLFESLVKRESGIKDSGHILPGHGGIMDRIDSLTAAAPVYLFLLWITGLPV